MIENFYKGKKVLVTGHTGFKGSWLSIWLHKMGAQVIGLALDPTNPNDNFVLSGIGTRITADLRGDIRNRKVLEDIFEIYKPEIVFHLAAQPLVRQSYITPLETYEVNVIGTINVLEAIRKTKCVRVSIMVTTDKCYENKDTIWGYRENEAMGGFDPYSSSKGAAEIAIASWRRSFFNPEDFEKHEMSLASVRAGNVVGGGDWSENRIIPDCIKALESGNNIEIRNPKAIRPWQHVIDPLYGYLLLAKKMWEEPKKYCEGWNFGPRTDSFSDVWSIAELVVKCYGNGNLLNISDPNAPHEANFLMLDISKAVFELEWSPKLDTLKSIEFTIEWYKRYKNKNVYEICSGQINNFLNL